MNIVSEKDKERYFKRFNNLQYWFSQRKQEFLQYKNYDIKGGDLKDQFRIGMINYSGPFASNIDIIIDNINNDILWPIIGFQDLKIISQNKTKLKSSSYSEDFQVRIKEEMKTISLSEIKNLGLSCTDLIDNLLKKKKNC